MIKTSRIILNELKNYKKPKDKLSRMVKEGKYIPIIRGLYEDNKNISPHLLAGSIYSPSYISFDYALSYYGLIPERVEAVTCASFEKKRKKIFRTFFGNYTYQDIPKEVFPYEVNLIKEGEYYFRIASVEKAICDKLYSLKTIKNQKELKTLLIDNLRIEKENLLKLDKNIIKKLSELYKSKNVKLFSKLLWRL